MPRPRPDTGLVDVHQLERTRRAQVGRKWGGESNRHSVYSTPHPIFPREPVAFPSGASPTPPLVHPPAANRFAWSQEAEAALKPLAVSRGDRQPTAPRCLKWQWKKGLRAARVRGFPEAPSRKDSRPPRPVFNFFDAFRKLSKIHVPFFRENPIAMEYRGCGRLTRSRGGRRGGRVRGLVRAGGGERQEDAKCHGLTGRPWPDRQVGWPGAAGGRAQEHGGCSSLGAPRTGR
jgi:hypothetical protein